ncbi:MAG TPA: AMP-binding protein [Nocardioides sp.]|jgi:fatty-acyl-CoA synthase|nr:AMP-binding protein [Nocardioides sp.]HET9840468.1 AMP-binding protein [Nocardioides sp.]
MGRALDRAQSLAGTVGTPARVLGGCGVLRPLSPVVLARIGRALKEWGTGPAGGFTAMALRDPGRTGLVDELGSLTFGELHHRSNALARALRERGVGEGACVAVMCRNHRGFVDALVATAKCGADILLLNTAFAGPQLVDVLDREAPVVVIHDQEFTGLLEKAQTTGRILGWVDEPGSGVESLEALIPAYDDSDLDAPDHHSRIIILTSGTTGAPKGAPRSEAGLGAAVSLLSRMPLRYGWRTHVAAPLFHTWGFAHLALAMLLGSTVVLRRRFDPEGCLTVVADERCDSLVVIPVMLQRILKLPRETLDRYPLPSLKVTAASGSALPGDLALEWMDTFGDNLYNIYGSTEVAYASIATPRDLREAPTSAGRPPWATAVKILDEDGSEVPRGETGRIFVGNGLLFEGYSGGTESKEVVGSLMSSGDVGRYDEDGRLYVEGRDDDMIVSGGENVFPQEVEDCLARHDTVVEAAAIGVDDDQFGTRLKAFVVLGDTGGSAPPSEDDLKTWVKQNLARYKVPREIVFLDELPRNATGKILKRELAEPD